MSSRHLGITLALLSLATSASAQQQVSVVPTTGDTRAAVPRDAISCTNRPVTLTCAGNACQLVLPIIGAPGCKLRIDDPWLRKVGQGRITEETSLRILVKDVNFLKYGLKFEQKEKVVESYVTLEKLWQQALSLMPEARAASRSLPSFPDAVKKWRVRIESADSRLTSFVSQYTTATLTSQQQDEIWKEAESIDASDGPIATLESLRAEAWKALSASGDFAVFDATATLHDATIGRLRAFQGRARLVKNGFPRRITFGESGTIVTVTMTLSDLVAGTEAGLTETVEFFVHSTLPVTFHAGYSYSGIDDFEFQPVAATVGEDLFSQIKSDENTSSFTAFLSYRLGRTESTPLNSQVFATLGTDFKDPGKRLFFGASLRVKRVFVSGGVATASVKEGEDRLTDAILAAGEVLGTRELFGQIVTTRQWRPYVSVSFAPF